MHLPRSHTGNIFPLWTIVVWRHHVYVREFHCQSCNSVLWISSLMWKLLVPDRLCYSTDCVVRGCPFYVLPWPAARQIFSGKLQAGGNSICLCLTGVLLWPPKRPIWTACAHFCESYPIDVLHIYFNILCLLLLEVSISVDLHLPYITIFPLWPVYMF